MIKNIEMIKIENMKRLEDEIVGINLLSKRNHIGYNTNNLFPLNLNLNTQLQRSKL